MIDRENIEPMRDEAQLRTRSDFPETESSGIGLMNHSGVLGRGGQRRVGAHGLQGDKSDDSWAGCRESDGGVASCGIGALEVGV